MGLKATTGSIAAIAGGNITGVQGLASNSAQWGIPFIVPASFTMGNNGAISAIGTALNDTYTGGAWMWMATGQIAAASVAGWYWFVGSTTTAGTLFNSTYTAGTPGLGTTTAFVTTGAGAATGVTAEVFGPTITVAANMMGPNGYIVHQYGAPGLAGAGTKTVRVRYSDTGGSIVLSQAPTTGGSGNLGYIRNRGFTNKQVTGNIQAMTTDTVTAAYLAVDTTAATKVVFTMQKSAATENQIIEGGFVAVAFGA